MIADQVEARGQGQICRGHIRRHEKGGGALQAAFREGKVVARTLLCARGLGVRVQQLASLLSRIWEGATPGVVGAALFAVIVCVLQSLPAVPVAAVRGAGQSLPQ